MFTTELGEASLLTTISYIMPQLGGFFFPPPLVSPEVDLLVPGVTALLPPRPGFYLLAASLRPVVTDRDGPAATSPATLRIGNNGSRTNVLTSTVTPTMAQLNSGLVPPFTVPAITPQQGAAMLMDLENPIECEVTAAAVGPTIARVRFVITGAFVKVADIGG